MYVLNMEVRESKQKGAGMGLFMLEKAKKGDRVAIYAGEVITQEEVSKRNSDYIFQVKQGQFIDAEKELGRKGRYICHAGPGSTSNASIASQNGKTKIDPKTKMPSVSVIAMKTIMSGENQIKNKNINIKY